MNRYRVCIAIILLFIMGIKGAKLLYAKDNIPSFENPEAVVSWINKDGAYVALQYLLAEANEPSLSKVLLGIRSGNEQWLIVLSKLRPPLMASIDAIQFDMATSEALDKNPAGVLRIAELINSAWNKLANIDRQDIHYPCNICGGYPDMWNEDISEKQRAAKAIPLLKKRKDTIEKLKSSNVSEPIKRKCLEEIINVINDLNESANE